MQTKLANLLIAYAPLVALVPAPRIQWDTLPQGAPQGTIAMTDVTAITDYHMKGASGLEFSRIQFDCRDSTAAKARAIAEALKARLSGFRGEFQGYQFQGCFQVAKRTSFGKVDANSWFTDSRDFEIYWAAIA